MTESLNFNIRVAQLSDLEEIARVHADGETEGPRFERCFTIWSNVLGGGPRRAQVWVALTPVGELLGFVSAGRCRVLAEKYDGEIIAIYVARDHRVQGVGRELVRTALEEFRARGYRSAMAWVPEAAPCAGEFFRRMGAAPLPERRNRGVEKESAFGWTAVDAGSP